MLIGFPTVRLRSTADAPLAHWVARLEDVFPDGRVSLVTGGALNGSQRQDRLRPSALVPGEMADLAFDLRFTTWTFRPGHRIPLAVSNSQFPMLWPTPHAMTARLLVGDPATWLELPFVSPASHPAPVLGRPPALPSRPDARRLEARAPAAAPTPSSVSSTDVTTWRKGGSDRYRIGARLFEVEESCTYSVPRSNPAAAAFLGHETTRIVEPGRTLELATTVEVRSDATHLEAKFERRLAVDGRPVRRRCWKSRVPREFN
ncbi:MAG: hypothetical protein HY814_09955 [Candidatus Riflebacteria bacterium]|nr:hypothetical protein [Candidatus Riflebacteria bacterium]